MKKIYFISLFVLSTFALKASDVKFYNINSLFGTSIRETSSICRDHNGFIWTSSKTGVIRVADNDCHTYQLPYFSADVVAVKLFLQGKKLYAYTNNGQLFLYDEIMDHFNRVVDFRKPFKNNYLVVNQMLADNSGTFWLATSGGLYKYNNEQSFRLCSKDALYSLIIDKNQHLYYENSKGLNQFNLPANSTKIIVPVSVLKTSNISKYFYDEKKSELWFGTAADGLFRFSILGKSLHRVLANQFPHQPILAISSATDSSVLVGIDGQGVWEISKCSEEILNIYKENVDDTYSLIGDGVYDILAESNRRVWVSTYTGGLSFYELSTSAIKQITHRVNSSGSLGNNCVNKVLQDRRGNVWFATNNGLSRWNMLTNQWNRFYQNNQEQAKVFLSLAEDNQGNIWCGTYSSGVYVLDGVTGREVSHFIQSGDKKQFSSKYIFDIFKDSEGDLWLGGIQSNLICYLSKQKNVRSYGIQPVHAFAELTADKILLACTYGLVLVNKQKGNLEYLLQGYLTQDIYVQGNNIWVATCGDGLLLYNYQTKKTTKFTTSNGLVSNYVNSIIEEGGFLWLGTENGICRFDPRTGKVLSIPIITANSGYAFNVGARFKFDNGDIIMGSNTGAILFNPNKLSSTSVDAHIFIHDIKVSGRSIRQNADLQLDTPVNSQSEVVLKHNQNTFEIDVLTIGLSPNTSRISWKMKGVDDSWSVPSNRKSISYTNLSSGKYTLMIRLYDSTLSKIVAEREIIIRVIPPFYATWWFILLVLLVIAYIVYSLLKSYTNRLEQIHTEDKIRFFTSTAHDIRTSLTLISAPIDELKKERNLTDKGRYYLDLAVEQSGRLSFVATQLLDFQKVDIGKGQLFLVMVDVVSLVRQRIAMFEAPARKKNITIKFSANDDTYPTAIDELKIEKVVDNLISNAIKYSYPSTTIDIDLFVDEHNWVLKVKDHGMGISENEQKKLFREFYRGDNVINSKIVGSGIGLLLVKSYVSMHQGVVSLQSEENNGACFTITIPYNWVDQLSVSELPEVSFEPELDEATEENAGADNEVLNNDRKISILVVEDNNDLQNFIKNAFEPTYRVTVAGDGAQAWELIQKRMPDLVISDIMMPVMDGFELCKLVKSTFDTSHIPVILLTALDEKAKQLDGLKLGADDYIVKPFDMTILMQRIKTIITNRDVVRNKALKLIRQTNTDQPILINELNDQFIKKALEVVKNNIANCEFGKDEFASAMHASPSLLYKKIKALTGQSPVDFIKVIRLDYSLELLQSKKYTVTEVSEMCGFASVGYFGTVFKKHFGKSPTEFLS